MSLSDIFHLSVDFPGWISEKPKRNPHNFSHHLLHGGENGGYSGGTREGPGIGWVSVPIKDQYPEVGSLVPSPLSSLWNI